MADPRLILFTRYPVAGQAKTRLIPRLGPEGAAAVHRQLTERTVAEMRESGLPIEIHYTGGVRQQFADWLGDDTRLVEQSDGDLGDRLQAATGEPPVIFLGADCPELRAHHLRKAAAALADHELVIGPAEDGGYWLIGMSKRHDWLFADMDWGTDTVFSETMRRLTARSIVPKQLETLADCDRPEDLEHWPWLAI